MITKQLDCIRCGKTVTRNNARQKYCVICSAYAQREKDKERRAARQRDMLNK